jgi:carboxypeptidase family protein/TonB-dependent receptor-like protein
MRPSLHRTLSTVLALFLLSIIPALAGTARVTGTIFTVDPNHVQTLWPNARITLKNLATKRELITVSNDLGQYSFSGILPGDYEISIALAGFAPASRRITLTVASPSIADFQLLPQSQSESVTVTANNPDAVDTSSSSGGGQILTTTMLKSLVRLNDDFQEALPLLPGVLRGPDGLIRIKGGNANQANALINNASIGDPFTGQPALRLPNAAVDSMRVFSNPFSSEFGDFSSGVIEVTTRGGGDEWKWLFEDPIPRFRWIDGSTHGIESLTPHLAFSGPLIKGKLYIFQSLYLGYDTLRVPSLPNPNNVRVDERINTQTQLDWDINPSHRLTAILTLDPENTNYANIDTFDPQPVTNDFRQRGFFTSVSDRWILSNGGFVQSLFSVKQLNSSLFPADPQPRVMTLFPEQNSGSFFESQHRNTWLYQWNQALHLRPLSFAGRHLLALGYTFARSTYDGSVSNLPVRVLREDGTLSSEITYNNPVLSSSASKNNVAVYLQDNWQLFPRLTLDLGVRLDHDSLSSDALDAAPRIGFVFAPTRDNRTAIRGGVGLFYDKIPLNVAAFPNFPAQTITQFASDGVTVLQPPTTYVHVIDTFNGALRLPYSLGTTIQLDRRLRQNLLLRLGYEHRQGYREFFVNPVPPSGTTVFAASSCNSAIIRSTNKKIVIPSEARDLLFPLLLFPSSPQIQPDGATSAQLQLLNSGTQTYNELLAMLRWNPTERTSLVASYVRSRAFGELNDYNQFFGNNPYPLIRPNQYGPLPSDAPNRVLFWGIIGLPHKLQFIPILDVHSGFPYSKLDENWNYIGARDEAGRFPTFASLDLKLQYPFDFKFHNHRIQFLGGLKVIDITNHYNPRDVQQYFASPNYGVFYNSVGRLWRIDGDFDF